MNHNVFTNAVRAKSLMSKKLIFAAIAIIAFVTVQAQTTSSIPAADVKALDG